MYKTFLLAGAAALISSAALAEDRKVLTVSNALDEITIVEDADEIVLDLVDQVQTKFEIDQLNRGAITSSVNVQAGNSEEFTSSAVSIANNASVDVIGATGGNSWQGNWGDATASMNADMRNASGVTELTAVAIGNNLSVNVNEYGAAVFSSTQRNDGNVTANLTATVEGEIENVTTTAVAIGNNTSIQVPHGGQFVGGVEQINNGAVNAYNNTSLNPMRRAVDPATSVAIGNNVSFTNHAPTVR